MQMGLVSSHLEISNVRCHRRRGLIGAREAGIPTPSPSLLEPGEGLHLKPTNWNSLCVTLCYIAPGRKPQPLPSETLQKIAAFSSL
ncbi:hypothetical protein KIL84_007106 [Mauremys mutica]|uniref:Uncharacterized protein n=1 Tax=Mauremys mutica TaxID=74926 RepID=A0A9D3X243_9SAUR|nr:hypothetical protein KIL84_007106 [Mauremys mutica]